MPFNFLWYIKQLFPALVLEFSTVIDNRIAIEPILLDQALRMINKVEKYGGIIIAPAGDIPKGKSIFFTAIFKSDDDLENFLNSLGIKRTG